MSAVVVTIDDETPTETLREFRLELIRRRVRAEVDEYNPVRWRRDAHPHPQQGAPSRQRQSYQGPAIVSQIGRGGR